MTTLIDDDLGLGPAGARAGQAGGPVETVFLTGTRQARQRLRGGVASSEGATIRPTSARTSWATAQSCIVTTMWSGPPQTLLLVRELDGATAVLGRGQLRKALEAGRGPLLLDCSAVRFIDAAWVGVLVSTARYGEQLGRKVRIAAASPRVVRVLRLVGAAWLMAGH